MAGQTKKSVFRILFLLAGVCSLYFVPWILVKAWIRPLPDSVQEQVEEAVELGFEGVVVYVDEKGEKPQSYMAGWHNRETQEPARDSAYFKIGSIKKLYDAVAVTKLVKAGVLSLDKTLADYLPALAGKIENAAQITVRQMVQHRSGLPNYTDTPNFWAEPTTTFDNSIALVFNKPALFEPGTDYAYCNTNYLLLNRIMDEVLNQPNFEFKQAAILNPLGLSNTFASIREVNMENMMSGYHLGHPHDLKTDDVGMVARAEDVAVFIRALQDGSVFGPGEREIYSELYKFEHSGWVPGYQSFANYYPDSDAVVVAFYSTTDPDLLYWNLAEIINTRIGRLLKSSKN